ncbi:MAG: hypothetical protein L0216_00530 [Planctomycetales bacterium]|nr:hypothetical protein [Planctomycetales bacterium]
MGRERARDRIGIAGIALLAAAGAAGAEEPAPSAPIRVDVIRRASRRPDDSGKPWPADFSGIELILVGGPEGDLPVARAREVLNAFASSGDADAFVRDVRGLREAERLYAIGAVGTVLWNLYTPGQSWSAPGHDESLAASGSWLRSGAGPDAGQCGAIHDSLRRLARDAGFRGSVALGVAAEGGSGHVVTAIPTSDGWTVLDYGTLYGTNTGSFGEATEVAQAAGGGIGGEALVYGDQYLYRHVTEAGRALRDFLEEDGTGGLGALLRGESAGPWSEGLTGRRSDGLWAADARGSGPSGFSGRASLGLLGGDGGWLESSPAGALGGTWQALNPGWLARARLDLSAVAWSTREARRTSLLAAGTGAFGPRVPLAGGRATIAALAEGAQDLGAAADEAGGGDGNPFVERHRAGAGAGWAGAVWGDLRVAASALALAELAPGEVRTERRTVVASEARADAAAGAGPWRVDAGWSWTRSGTEARGALAAASGPVEARLSASRTWARFAHLEPSRDRVALRLAHRPTPAGAAVEVAWERGRGAHAGKAELLLAVSATLAW